MLSQTAGRAVKRLPVFVVPLSSIIQQRGFRAVRPFPQGGGPPGKSTDESPFDSLLKKFTHLKSSPDAERLSDYKAKIGKMSDAEARQFSEGYVQALLSSQTSQAPPKRFRIFRFIGGTLILAWIGYNLVMILLNDKKSGLHFIFSSPQEVKPEQVNVTFDDVRGMDEAKSEVTEIVNYLRDPDHYSRLGGRLPKGVLLVGPPGTGKTLLARAIAGEARVPFFHTSGSEFDEVLVGQGARRVRDLFERAKQKAPCIVFIDEIDSVGSKRVTSSIHPYANQTINQLLNEMDGFERNEGVIVIGATNRVEDLDKALLRPGRFDVQVQVPVPDLAGRIDIFLLYLSRIVHEKLVVSQLAKGTTGFTGADIENMVNQAALKAASDGSSRVGMRHLDEARDRIIMGPARAKGRFPDEDANRNTAYHEAGHTLVACYTKDAMPLHKVTIIPRGGSLGHTAFLPDKDSVQVNKSQMLAQLDVMMGGRVAEELTFGLDKVTTGASDDLRKATELAVTMVKRLGMSEQGGLRDYTIDVDDGRGEALVKLSERSQRANETLDSEIDRMLKESYNRAKAILTEHAKEHKALATALYEYETLTAEEVHTVVNGGTIVRPFAQQPALQKDGKKRRSRPAIIKIQVD